MAVDDSEGGDIWLHDLERGTETRFTSDPAADRAPLWSPDGEHLVFASDRDGPAALFWKRVNAPGPAELLATASDGLTAIEADTWSADGQTLVFYEAGGRSPGGPDIRTVSIQGERTATTLVATNFAEGSPAVSHDGNWLAYASNETGESEVYVQRFPGLGEKVTISTDGGRQPLWSRDGSELFYRGPRGMMAVSVETDPTFRAGDPEVLFEDQYSGYRGRGLRSYDLAPDGRFLMVKEGIEANGTEGPTTQIVLVQNWFEELKRLVPTD